ncbi:hypothetical protein DL93DRAFT_312487 [Clavulina sp. PMI_390]|nr:hypothetical protein DL93DRAFT_312487 [Clavulina sp. PMI_390]
MSWKTVLRDYAVQPEPLSIPYGVRLKSYPTREPRTLAIFDKYGKAKFHFLLLPSPNDTWSVRSLNSLRSVLREDRARAKALLETMHKDALDVVRMIRMEMNKKYGCEWGINIGFHAVPSMDHIHLHIISNDLISDHLKKKRHYNSFHPSLGFFIHLDEVLSWFDLPDDEFKKNALLDPNRYDPMLDRPLVSWRTGKPYRTMPALKDHLEEDWLDETFDGRVELEERALKAQEAAAASNNEMEEE